MVEDQARGSTSTTWQMLLASPLRRSGRFGNLPSHTRIVSIKESIISWNLGGAKFLKLGSHLEALSSEDASVFLLQEVPKGMQGWSRQQMWGKFALISYQPHGGYRGTGIAFNVSKWALLKKKPTKHGAWFLLQHVETCQKVWCGSGCFSTGVSNHEHESEISVFLSGLPSTTEPVVLGADCNTALGWTLDGDQKRPSCGAGKTLAMLDQMLTRRLHPIPQENVCVPT